jgi:hypothetical protein
METMETTKTINMVTFKGAKKELVEVLNGYYSTADLAGKSFALNSSRNIIKIKIALEDIELVAAPSEDFLKLADKVKKVQEKENAAELIKAIEDESPEVVDARKAQLEAVTEMLEEEIEIDLFALTEDMLPEDIKSHQITLLNVLIK